MPTDLPAPCVAGSSVAMILPRNIRFFRIESTKTTSMEDVSTGLLEKN